MKLTLLIVLIMNVVIAVGQDDLITRRRDFRRSLAESTTPGQLLQRGMSDSDPVIRRYSLYCYFQENGEKALPELLGMINDPDILVMKQLIACAANLNSQEKSDQLLRKIAESAVDAGIRREAGQISSFRFYRENKRLRDNPTHDHEIITVKSIPLPLNGWSFRPDPMGDGHRKDWFKVGFDDSRWQKLNIGTWEEQGYQGYDGVAWYRIKFTMPAKPDCNAVELAFQGVDEMAWVWLNGRYIGQHDIGPAGWNKPFWLDVSEEMIWGRENVLVVRVEDTASAGGIWKPVTIEILK